MGERSKTRFWFAIGFGGLLAAVVVVGALVTGSPTTGRGPVTSIDAAAQSNPNLDPGTPVSRPAPNFHLTDQFGHRVSLSSFRGRAVLLAFVDSQCTTICPLTTTAMVDAKRFLGAAGARVQLLGIDANPKATAQHDLRSYSSAHGLLHKWQFLSGSSAQLKRVWKSYGIGVEIQHGLIDHTPALFLIDPQGKLRRVFMTQMNFASVPQLGQLLAHDVSRLLPGHPAVDSTLSYAETKPISPNLPATLPKAGGGTVALGPGRARLLLFFASWDTEDLPELGRRMLGLSGYRSARGAASLPPLTMVDEGSVEPSPEALTHFLGSLPRPLSSPVAIDQSGKLADGYQVQDLPWLVLVSATGRILWYYDVATQGWLSPSALATHVRAALAHPEPADPRPNSSTTAAPAQPDNAPAPLAALHRQASQLLGAGTAFRARLRALRGHPVVVNAWASWCTPCQREFNLFASASVQYGSRVAFLGANTNDSAGNARAFLAKHRVDYPSYQTTTGQLSPLAAIEGLPTTIFINSAGKVVHVQTGQYESQGALDADIAAYALGH